MSMNKRFLDLAMLIEGKLFPLIFFITGVINLMDLYAYMDMVFIGFEFVTKALIINFIFSGDFLLYIVLALFNFLVCYALIVRGQVIHKPENYTEVLVPFVCTFFGYLHNAIVLLPGEWNVIVVPSTMLVGMRVAGMMMSISGITLACIGIFQLRKSFSVYVEVRDVVSHGLYKFVRHPIYLGYIMASCGMMMMDPGLLTIFIVICYFFLITWRADMEEKKMSQHSKEYRVYKEKTPFLFAQKKG